MDNLWKQEMISPNEKAGPKEFTPEELSDFDICHNHTILEKLDIAGRLVQTADPPQMKMVWLELNGCSGNIISLLNGSEPDFEYMISDMVNLVYDQSLIPCEGERAMDMLFSVLDQQFILAVEGAVSTKNNGNYQIIGKWKGTEITGLDAIRLLGEKALHVIAVGACASHGGVSSGSPNPAQCVSVSSVLNRKVINLPGCPCHPEWFLSTLEYLLHYGEPQLDEQGRPVFLYGITIHQRCERRSYFDAGVFATHLGEPTCMFRLGCKGPRTPIDCPIRKWNDRVSWPVQANTPCIGCAQFGFPDKMEPFVTFSNAQTGQGGSPNPAASGAGRVVK
ncbi:MAG TPA: hydrogenase small subunit [Anaerovoracaceae bacterium]|nr:hydrogenase small subunit [Anaerovoracaceae bacterium]